MNIFDDLNRCKTKWGVSNKKIPVTYFKPTEENALRFNRLLEFCRQNDYYDLQLTEKGNISKKGFILPAYSYTWSRMGAQLLIIDEYSYKIQFRAELDKDSKGRTMTGTRAYFAFKNMCLENGINLDDYAIENGKEVKDTIEKPLVRLTENGLFDAKYMHVNHIDFHSSYPSGLINHYPEFEPVIRKLYEGRNTHPEYKQILNLTIGMMHSRLLGYKFSELAKKAIEDNNRRVLELSERLEESGRIPLLYNTDGIWYYGEVYHGEGEGKDLNQWSNDHVNCVFRMRSTCAYEYIEDNVYKPVVKGVMPLDKKLPRDKWKWGDIYKGNILTFSFSDLGILIIEGDNYE